MENKILKTLFVGIDVSSKENILCALDFSGDKLLTLKALNNQPGAESILNQILHCLDSNSLKRVVIAYSSIEELIDFISEKGKNRFSDPAKTAKLLQKAARDSYRLDKVLYEPLNVSIASSFNVIQALQSEVKVIDKAIEKIIKGLNTTEYQSLTSIPGIGPVLASGILSEIGTIHFFHSHNALAKYAGLTWRVNQSGNFLAEQTRMTKTGNKYLRYYLIEAANSVKNHTPEYKEYYYKKFNEVNKYSHKRALALTSRKLVRLVFGLLTKNQLYSSNKVGERQ